MIVDPETAKRIRVVISDCDGVLTDGRVTYVPVRDRLTGKIEHHESCTYSRRDGRGVEKLREMGVRFVMVTRETAHGVHEARSAKLDAKLLVQKPHGSRLAALHVIEQDEGARPVGEKPLSCVCYIGDSDTDAEALRAVAAAGGLAVTPSNGHPSLGCCAPDDDGIVRAWLPGGDGVIEEIADAIVQGRI